MSVDFAGRPITGSVDTSKFLTNTSADISYLNVEGDNMLGALNMNKNKITNVANPTEDNDCVNKLFIDNKLNDYDNKLNNVNFVYNEFNKFKQAAIVIHEDLKRYKDTVETKLKNSFNFDKTISTLKYEIAKEIIVLKKLYEDVYNLAQSKAHLREIEEKKIVPIKNMLQSIKNNFSKQIEELKNLIPDNKLILLEGSVKDMQVVHESTKPFLILHEFWYNPSSGKYIKHSDGYFKLIYENQKYKLKYTYMFANDSTQKYKVLIYEYNEKTVYINKNT